MKTLLLHSQYQGMGATFTNFAQEWHLPMYYAGILKEYRSVRANVGLFDVSHMGIFTVKGKTSLDLLQKICTNDIATCEINRGMYSYICNENGNILDDIFVYHIQPEQYILVVNASNIQKDYLWIRSHCDHTSCDVSNQSDAMGLFALQGKNSTSILRDILQIPLEFNKNHIQPVNYKENIIFVACTGYTGEIGYEILFQNDVGAQLLDAFMCYETSIPMCGLGARDLLRLEQGYMLYGMDISEENTPLEIPNAWMVKWNKSDFLGLESLKRKKNMHHKQLIGLQSAEASIPRRGQNVMHDQQVIGKVTSGCFSPLLKKGIALAYVTIPSDTDFIQIDNCRKSISVSIKKYPFLPIERS